MMSLNFVILLSCIFTPVAVAKCSCEVDQESLECTRGSIENFPSDVSANCADLIANNTIRAVNLQKQLITELGPYSFEDFPDLVAITLSFNDISYIDEDAFANLDKVQWLLLEDNNITDLPIGLFDNLVSLETLDLSGNPVSNYITESWTMCHGLGYGDWSVSGVEILQDFSDQDTYGKKYCDNWVKHHNLNMSRCKADGNVLDCSANTDDFDVQGLGCHLSNMEHTYTKIKTNFPIDVDSIEIDDFGKGQSLNFFRDFNGVNAEINQRRRSVTFYGTSFDLSSLEDNTNPNVTEEVIVKADTVFLSKPFTINYKLKIIARKVKIDQVITMEMPVNDFEASNMLRTHFQKNVVFGQSTLVRHRQFGLVEIIDSSFDLLPTRTGQQCQTMNFDANEVETRGWFDQVLVNLMYVCASTVLPTNNKLASGIANFTLNFYHQLEVVNDVGTYVTAQKFKQVQEQCQTVKAHTVPAFGASTAESLADLLHYHLDDYYDTETNQYDKLEMLLYKMVEISNQFLTIEQQQEYYFQQELFVLEAIFAATDNSWDFEFPHRNTTQAVISNALKAIENYLSGMKGQELKALLEQAESSVLYYTDAKHKYESEATRYSEKVDSGVTIIKNYNARLVETQQDLEYESDQFEANSVDYSELQTVQWFQTFIFCMESFISGTDIDDVEEVIYNMDTGRELLLSIKDLFAKINPVKNLVKDEDVDGLDDLTSDPSTTFANVLKHAVEMKLQANEFEDLKTLVEVQLAILNQETNYDIPMESLIRVIQRVADVGNLLVGECSTFADDLLNLMDVKGDVALADQDLNKAVEQVENIGKAIQELERSKYDYEAEMNQIQREYQDTIQRMQEEYEHMTPDLREKYREEIMLRFDDFNQVFDQMKANFMQSVDKSISSAQDKIYGLKSASLTQRSMLGSLFKDFCDGLYYHSFTTCSTNDVPLLGEDMNVLLSKVFDLQWRILTNVNNLPNYPSRFNRFVVIEDVDEYHKPLFEMLSTSKTSVNLKDYMDDDLYHMQWRWRIDELDVLLLDQNGNVIQTNGQDFSDAISIGVTFPSLFNDTDPNKEGQTFLGHEFYCRSTYEAFGNLESNDPSFFETCRVNEEFSAGVAKTSPNGKFTLKLLSGENTLDYRKVAKIRINFKGTYIPFLKNSNFDTL